MNVLIVSKTHAGTKWCIGGLTAGGVSLRLQTATGDFQPANTPLQVGQVWEMAYQPPAAPRRAPHVEDVLVQTMTLVGTQANLAAHLARRVAIWRGGPGVLFGGGLGFTGSRSAYINERAVPAMSTGYWMPDAPLVLDGGHYVYRLGHVEARFKYVGAVPAIPVIPVGTLVRVSLAGWWRPDDAPDFEERCYVQVSGWY